MRMLKLAAVNPDYRARIAKQDFRGGFHDARLSGPSGTEEQKTRYRPLRRVQAGTEDLVQVHHGVHGFFLLDDLRAQGRVEFQRFRTAKSRIENDRLSTHGELLMNLLPKDGRGETNRIKWVQIRLVTQDIVLAENWPYHSAPT